MVTVKWLTVQCLNFRKKNSCEVSTLFKHGMISRITEMLNAYLVHKKFCLFSEEVAFSLQEDNQMMEKVQVGGFVKQ